MTKYGFRLQYSFRLLLAACLVCGILTFCFADQMRQTIVSFYDPNPTSFVLHVTHTAGMLQTWDSWEAMHEYYEDEFVNGEGFGLRRLVDFDAPEYRPIEISGKIYRVEALELISLEERNHPRAYVNTAGYPVRKHYKQQKTRELLPFEKTAVRRIAGRQDVVYDGNSLNPRVVGAVRARKSCLQCHDARVGELLGAFSYRLR